MKQTSLSPDDPRLTAYAFDEMSAAERAEFEPILESDPAARRTVEEIRAAGHVLTAALEHEPIVAPGTPAKLAGRMVRFPQLYYMVSGLAAACFAVFFIYWQRNHDWRNRQYVEVGLAGQAAAVGDDKSKAEAGASFALPTLDAEADASVAVATPNPPGAVPVPSATAPVPARGGRTNGFGALQEAKKVAQDRRERQQRASVAAPTEQMNTEAYAYRRDNAFRRVADEPQSTFSIDVDTASYANVRRFLNQGQRPPADAVRIEEMVNYFPYRYAPPSGEVPFAAHLEVAAAPWADEHRLVRIGLKGREVNEAARPPANLVFLVDVSGSMQEPNKLPLVKQSLRLLVDKLRSPDRVALAVYAGASGLALASTPLSQKSEILEAIDRLEAGGSTNGAMGIQLAYDVAKANFIPAGVNRVVLATDGDFNVGTTSEGELTRLIEAKAKTGVFLSVLGFGMGNYKDATLEMLADKGNGNYAYIDSLAEARKSLVEQAGGTLVTIAKDVKIQIEFNPALVQAYRLIGYENRLLANEDFANDKVDAGEVGAGHTVTALYEVVPVGVALPPVTAGSPLKYQAPSVSAGAVAGRDGELLTVSVRYKEPAGEVSRLLEFPVQDQGATFDEATADFKFAAAVAGFGMMLRESPDRGTMTLAQITDWARAGIDADQGGYRSEFVGLAERSVRLLQ